MLQTIVSIIDDHLSFKPPVEENEQGYSVKFMC